MKRLAWAGILGVSLCLTPAARASGCKVAKVAEMPMNFWHNRIFLPVSVNNVPGTFLLDTGAFNSQIDTAFAARAGVGWDRMQAGIVEEGVGGRETRVLHPGHLRMLEFGGAKIPDREMPMGEVPMPKPEGGNADGIIGADMLNLLDLELDFQTNKVAFWRLYDCPEVTPVGWTGDYAAIPLTRQASKHVKIPIWLDGAVIQATLDTGAGGLLVDRATALQAGATSEDLAHDPVAGGIGIGGRANGHIHRFKMLLIGKDVYRDVDAFVPDTSGESNTLHALVGMTYLRNHRVWFSYGTETLFLQASSQK